MSLLNVNKEKCIGCGVCAEVCPKNYIGMTEERIPIDAGLTCIACGHCVAVCPQSALDHVHASLKGQVLNELNLKNQVRFSNEIISKES